MILLTGAAGKTGLPFYKYLSSRGVTVRALVRNQLQALKVVGFANTEPIIGDLASPETHLPMHFVALTLFTPFAPICLLMN